MIHPLLSTSADSSKVLVPDDGAFLNFTAPAYYRRGFADACFEPTDKLEFERFNRQGKVRQSCRSAVGTVVTCAGITTANFKHLPFDGALDRDRDFNLDPILVMTDMDLLSRSSNHREIAGVENDQRRRAR